MGIGDAIGAVTGVAGGLFGGDDGGGGGQSQSPYHLLPEDMRKTIDSVVTRASDLSEKPFDPYLGQRIADFTPDQLAAFERVRGGIDRYQDTFGDLYGQTQDLSQKALAGPTSADISSRMSPYMQNVIDASKREAVSDFDGVLKGIRDQAVNVGAFGGDRMGLVESEAYGDLLDRLSDMQVTGQQQAFGQALDQYNRGLSMGSNLLTTGANIVGAGESSMYKGIGALSDIGTQQQRQEQLGLDVDYEDFIREQEYPYEQIDFLQGTLGGLSPFFTGSPYTTPQSRNKVNDAITGGLGGFMTGASGAYNNVANSLFGTNSFGNLFGGGSSYTTLSPADVAEIQWNKEGGPVKKYAFGGLIDGLGLGIGSSSNLLPGGLLPALMGGRGGQQDQNNERVLQGNGEAPPKKKEDKKGRFGRILGQVIGTYFGGPIGGTIGGTIGSHLPFEEGGYVKRPSIANFQEGGNVLFRAGPFLLNDEDREKYKKGELEPWFKVDKQDLSKITPFVNFARKFDPTYRATEALGKVPRGLEMVSDYFFRDEPTEIEKASRELVEQPGYTYEPGSRAVQNLIEQQKQPPSLVGGGPRVEILEGLDSTEYQIPAEYLDKSLLTSGQQGSKGEPTAASTPKPKDTEALIGQAYGEQPSQQSPQTQETQKGEKEREGEGINMPLLNAGIALLAKSSDLNHSIAEGLNAFATTKQKEEQAKAEAELLQAEQQRKQQLEAIELQIKLNKERRAEEYLKVQKGYLEQAKNQSAEEAMQGMTPAESKIFLDIYQPLATNYFENQQMMQEPVDPSKYMELAQQAKQMVKAMSGGEASVVDSPMQGLPSPVMDMRDQLTVEIEE